MNILFVNYGDFTTNSLNHIAGFAHQLRLLGHDCAVAVPTGKDTVTAVPGPDFLAVTCAEVLARPACFRDGRAADIVHAWTPRESVRKFLVAHQRLAAARVVIHLEDDEQHLLEVFTGRTVAELRAARSHELAQWIGDTLAHPLRQENLLRLADGATVITDSLRRFVPAQVPVQSLPPGVDFDLYQPRPADPALRRELGLEPDEKVIVYTGSVTFANEAEMLDLYAAVARLNQRGVRTRLVRTGLTPPTFAAKLPAGAAAFALDLGFVAKRRLPALLSLADVLVQPGRPGPFNDYRLPSKLPEFLAAGKPVLLPATNLAARLRNGHDAVFLRDGSPEDIAGQCQNLFANPALCATLGRNAAAAARQHFDLPRNTALLAEFYAGILARPAAAAWDRLADPFASESVILPAYLADRIARLAPAGEAAAEIHATLDNLALLLRQMDGALGEQDLRVSQIVVEKEARVAALQRKLDLTAQHTANLEHSSAAAQQHARELERALQQSEAGRLEAEQDSSTKTAQLVEVRATLQKLSAAHRQALETLRQREAELAQRNEKIQRMQESFSWRATAFLRHLRRIFVDPFPAKKKILNASPPADPGPGAGAAPAAPVFRYSVDYPQSWSFPAKKILIRGWCFAQDATALKHLRARVGTRTVNGVYGLKRLDVLAALRDCPQAEYCGWKIEVPLEESDRELRLEAGDTLGHWHAFFSAPLSVGDHAPPAELTTYERWVEAYDRPSPGQLREMAARLDQFALRPCLSILMPVYDPPEKWLRRAVDSVRRQIYPHWELCIADDASTAPHVRPFLEEAARADRRIKVTFRSTNGHISAASNSALEGATGEFIGLLDHDDELAPHALYEVVAALQAHPDTDFFYSDEDKIDENDHRHEPYFKPDWLPDLYHGQNYTSHFTVYRAALVRAAGGFRVGYEGSQDWDLGLRLVERLAPERIRHIPKILYHWRAIPGSTALLSSEKDYHAQAAYRALADHFARCGQKVELLPVPGAHWRVKYPLPPAPPLVSLIIPTHNGLEFLRPCVDGILEKTLYPRFELIVVDNGSDDPATLAYLGALADGRHPLLRPGRTTRVLRYAAPFNFSAINNHAVRAARGEIIGLLNNDLAVITPGWLEEMAGQALRPGIGCVGAMLYYPNDTIQHAGVIVGLGGVAGHAFRDFPRHAEGVFNRARLVQNYSAVTAACLVIRKAVYEQVGGLDEQKLAVAFNDIDFCLKVRAAGYRNLWTPFAEFYHHESVSRGAEDTPEKHERFRSEVETMLARWPEIIRHDPAYNPNLTLEFTDFTLAAPPRAGSG